MAEKEYKWIGEHPQDIEGGQVLAPGDLVNLDDSAFESLFMRELRDSGQLLDTAAQTEANAKLVKKEANPEVDALEAEALAGTGSGREK